VIAVFSVHLEVLSAHLNKKKKKKVVFPNTLHWGEIKYEANKI
jgi:hypothetical protein